MRQEFFGICRRLAFGVMVVLAIVMVFGTVLPESYNIYTSWWFVALWVILAVCGMVWLLHAVPPRSAHALLLHGALLLVLTGAAVSFLTSQGGVMHLRIDHPIALYADGEREGVVGRLPFELTLQNFHIVRDTASGAALDYVCQVCLREEDGEVRDAEISTNHSLLHRGVRLWLQGYDADFAGVRLGVRLDFWGTLLSYLGYVLLFVGFVWTLISHRSNFQWFIKNKKAMWGATVPFTSRSKKCFLFVAHSVLAIGWFWLTAELLHRGLTLGRLPMTNETEVLVCCLWLMLFIMLASACLRQRSELFRLLNAMGWLSVFPLGLALYASRSTSVATRPLIAILDTPLLDVHVAFVVVGYTLLILIFCCSAVALLGTSLRLWICDTEERAAHLSRLLLYPAVACLAVGIFLGAIWGGEAWGRYWGWDPKETWALITLLVYALPLHHRSLPRFAIARFYHLYMLLAFATVVMTFFGVNRLLGGLHSYA